MKIISILLALALLPSCAAVSPDNRARAQALLNHILDRGMNTAERAADAQLDKWTAKVIPSK